MERRILIVDGIDLARRFVKQSLEKNFGDAIIEEACDLIDAQKMLQGRRYNLVICDFDIQPSGGAVLLDWVRSHSTCEKTPFIMIVPTKDSAQIESLLQQGASAGIIKPFTVTELIRDIAPHLPALKGLSCRRWTSEGFIRIHCSGQDIEGQLIDPSLGGALFLLRRDAGLSILDELSFGFCPEKEVIFEKMKGFIIRIQAVNTNPEAQYVKYALKFGDISPDVEARLPEYLKKTHPYEW